MPAQQQGTASDGERRRGHATASAEGYISRMGHRLILIVIVCLMALGWTSCASKPAIVAVSPSGAVAGSLSLHTVLVLEPQSRIVHMLGRETATVAEDPLLTRELMLATASQSLRRRHQAVQVIAPGEPTWPADRAELLEEWSQRSLQITRAGQAEEQGIGALLDEFGLESAAAVLFTSLEARLGHDGTREIPLVVHGDAATHMSVFRTALYVRNSRFPAWTNTIVLRASPTVESPQLREALRQLYLPLEKKVP